MGDTISIRPTDLLIDPENPRLSLPNQSQRDAFRLLAGNQQRKIVALAKDILGYGISPAELPIVIREKGALKRYVVLEGNRRISALKALENPEPLMGAVDTDVLSQLRVLSREYQNDPLDYITCYVAKDREEANHWIELRHTGQNEGAGLVPWGSDESSRFRARTGLKEVHIQALDFLDKHGLTPKTRSKTPTTSLKRLLSTPEVRSKLGIDIESKELIIKGNEKSVAKALLYVVKDLASGDTKVSDIYTKAQRLKYINGLPKSLTQTPKGKGAKSTSGATPKATPRHRRTRQSPRNTLIPKDCVLSVDDPRASDIEEELLRLKLDVHTNAIAVLFRVFVELSVDVHMTKHGLSAKTGKLREKMQVVLADLKKNQKITTAQATPVSRALQKNSFLAPSVDLMNDYVHNKHVFPAPGDLRAHWSSLQPFMMAIWSV